MSGDVLARMAAWALALALVALPFVAVLNGWLASGRWPVRQIVVKAEFRQVDAAEVRAAVQPLLGAGFFAVQPDVVRRAVVALPWVERAEVRKRWPDAIELVVHERHAFARWGEDRLVSRKGALFEVAGATGLESLPRLGGPDERVAEVLSFYSESRAELAGSGLVVDGVGLSPRGGWRLKLDSGVVLDLGREKPRARLRRFLDVWPRLAGSHAGPPLAIDLRYENGFAVQWAPAGAGNGESGIGNGQEPARGAVASSDDEERAIRSGLLALSRFPVASSSFFHSPFPIPDSRPL
ncbi:MAG: cell division protein FtsQ/DivIB [Xanthomonadales bacterium]|nr:cell division protein FtsQ/DivIB [Xanthomonadales bacterium]